jgi:hypothetical protein
VYPIALPQIEKLESAISPLFIVPNNQFLIHGIYERINDTMILILAQNNNLNPLELQPHGLIPYQGH